MIHELVRALVTATGAENAATLDNTKIQARPAAQPNAFQILPRAISPLVTIVR